MATHPLTSEILRPRILEALAARGGAPCWMMAQHLGLDLWDTLRLDQELEAMKAAGLLKTTRCGGVDAYSLA